MRSNSGLIIGFKSFSLATLLAVTSTSALAQNLKITGNSVRVTSGGGFDQTRVIPANGILPSLTIPVAGVSGGAATPNFTFTLASTSVGDGEYQFSAGFVIDDDNSARRIEVMIPTIKMNFTGGALTGTVDAGSTVTVLGRAADNTTQLSATLSNALFNFNGTSLSFDSGAQVSEIAGKGGILGDIATTIAANGAYTYAVVLKQKSGGQTLSIDRDGGVALGCAPSTTFVLNSNQFSSLGGGFGLQGQFLIAAGAAGAAPTAFSSTCTTNISSGGGGSTTTAETQTTAVDTATTALTTAISSSETFTDAVATQLESLTTDTSAAATSVGTGLSDGTVSVDTGFELLSSIAIQFGNLSALPAKISSDDPNATAKNSQITSAQGSLLGALTSIAGGLKETSFSTAQAATLSTTLSTLNTKVAELILAQLAAAGVTLPTALSTGTLVKDISETVTSLESSLGNILGNPTFTMTSGLFASIQDVSQSSGKGIFAELGTNLGLTQTYTNDANAKTILANNTTLLSRLVDAIGVNLGIEIDVDETATNAAVVTAGLTGSSVSALTSDLRKFVKADSLQIDSSGSVASASSLLGTALGADTISVNAITGAVNYTNGGSSSVAFVKSVMPAPSIIPTGTHILSDGSTLINDGAVMFQLVSGSNNILDFAGAIQSAGSGTFTTSITGSGIIKLTETATGAIFSSTMSTSALGSATATATTTFETATGNPADSAYRFVVQYDDGTRQEILPAISDSAFFTSVGNAGFQVTTDRKTGVVNIGGFSFRPDFFQTPLTAADLTYHTANADSSGVAYRAVDANGDGVTDYQVLTSTGVQTVYTQP